MTAVGVAVAGFLLLALLVKGKQVKIGSVLVGILLGLLVGATPAGPATAHAIQASGEWVWTKVSSL